MSLSILNGMTPSDFGLDSVAYPAYRNHPETEEEVQLEVVEFLAYAERRFACAAAPVGVGKSLIAMTLAQIAKTQGKRTAIVVPYKGLQDQYAACFPKHLVDIRGKANYRCGDYNDLTCKGGASMGCRYLKGNGCEYERKVWAARNEDVILTNYDYWLNKNDHGGGLERTEEEAALKGGNPIEQLILDEGDEGADRLSKYLAVTIFEKDIAHLAAEYGIEAKELSDEIKQWKDFAGYASIQLEAQIRTAGMELAHLGRRATSKHVEQLHRLEFLLQRMERIAGIQDDWVLEKKEGTKYGRLWSFDVVWPGRYAERFLFRGIQKVVIMSGTLTSKDLAQLGVKKEEYEYKQWARIFPASRQPIYSIPPRKKKEDGTWVKVMLKAKMPDEDRERWLELIDEIIGGRLDRKGLIQCTSYDYAKFIVENSKHGAVMMRNTGDPDDETASEIAEAFYKAEAPCVLVSPSFSRGWDFSFDRAEYTIIAKFPFIPTQSKVMQARLERDKVYDAHLALKKVEQGAGRVMRAEDDRGEVFLCDGHFDRMLWNHKGLVQGWFGDAVRKVIEVPKAPKKLEPKIIRKKA